jgi:hypothetical protein
LDHRRRIARGADRVHVGCDRRDRASRLGGAALASALGSAPELLFIPPLVLAGFAVYVHVDTRFQTTFNQSRARLRTRVPLGD